MRYEKQNSYEDDLAAMQQTALLLFTVAHDVHGFEQLLVKLDIILSSDVHVAVRQVAVFLDIFQKILL